MSIQYTNISNSLPETKRRMYPTKVINIIGGPGCGKELRGVRLVRQQQAAGAGRTLLQARPGVVPLRARGGGLGLREGGEQHGGEGEEVSH